MTIIVNKNMDLTGRIFGDGKVKVIEKTKSSKDKRSRWICECVCGNRFITYGSQLRAGKTTSCGCLSRNEMSAEEMKKQSISLSSLDIDASDPYHCLANAIVAVSADDYRDAIKDKNYDLMDSIEQFFFSDWYKVLTNIRPEYLIDMIKNDCCGSVVSFNV